MAESVVAVSNKGENQHRLEIQVSYDV